MTTNTAKKIDLVSLADRLKSADYYSLKHGKTLKIFFWLLAIAWLLMILTIDFSLLSLIHWACVFLAVVYFVFILEMQHAGLKSIDYSLPTTIMLKKAKRRYSPFRQIFLVLTPVILFNIALSITLTKMSIGTFQIWYWGGALFVSLIDLLLWKIKYKPLYDNLLLLAKEIY